MFMAKLDRFESGLQDSQWEEPIEISDCAYEWCNAPIYFGEKNWCFDGEWFCSATCFANHLGAEEREV